MEDTFSADLQSIFGDLIQEKNLTLKYKNIKKTYVTN